MLRARFLATAIIETYIIVPRRSGMRFFVRASEKRWTIDFFWYTRGRSKSSELYQQQNYEFLIFL